LNYYAGAVGPVPFPGFRLCAFRHRRFSTVVIILDIYQLFCSVAMAWRGVDLQKQKRAIIIHAAIIHQHPTLTINFKFLVTRHNFLDDRSSFEPKIRQEYKIKKVQSSMTTTTGSFRTTVWDPTLIIFQIICLQSAFYSAVSTMMFLWSLASGLQPTLTQMFTYEVFPTFFKNLNLLKYENYPSFPPIPIFRINVQPNFRHQNKWFWYSCWLHFVAHFFCPLLSAEPASAWILRLHCIFYISSLFASTIAHFLFNLAGMLYLYYNN
jgi:hypothetical protein